MTPESKARVEIDEKLVQAGWIVQDFKQLNFSVASGVAVREYPTDTGPADFVLFVNRQPLAVFEAKRDETGENITVTENQTERYATSSLKWRKGDNPLPFLFEATGKVIRFTDGRNPIPRSREIFHFFKPETLAEWYQQTDTLRRRLTEKIPALPELNLRDFDFAEFADKGGLQSAWGAFGNQLDELLKEMNEELVAFHTSL